LERQQETPAPTPRPEPQAASQEVVQSNNLITAYTSNVLNIALYTSHHYQTCKGNISIIL